ncbi:MAG: hypothetical protein Q9191_000453 [Dirinaria sp. TL-2023a]
MRYHQPDNEGLHEHDIEFPLDYLHGTCQITINVVDPNHGERPDADAWYDIAPNEFREMAGWVIRQCVESSPPVGGFVTRNISNAINYLRLPTATLQPAAWPLNATFFTVTITTDINGGDDPNPGNYDPTTGGAIFSSLYETLLNTPMGSPLWNSLSSMAERLNRYWGLMGRAYDYENGYGNPWYGPYGQESLSPDTVTYECDAKLGNPQHVDCSQLQYSQLDPTSDSLSLEPGLTKFLHSETCNIGITVSESTTVTWKQIKSAVNEIIEICVNNPLRKAVGGRAYYGDQALFKIGSAGRKKRDSDSLNALPPGANITLFQQLEIYSTFPADREEIGSCTWQNAVRNQDVRACRSVHHRPHS